MNSKVGKVVVPGDGQERAKQLWTTLTSASSCDAMSRTATSAGSR
jgi:hypothetical protein